MSDRVLVMREGRQMAIFDRDDANQESVMTAAMGQASTRAGQGARHELAAAPCPPGAGARTQPAAAHHRAVLFFGSLIDNYYTVAHLQPHRLQRRHHHHRRGRPDAGRADPQHRPLGRLDRRLHRLFRRHAASPTTTICTRSSPFCIAVGLGGVDGRRQRRARRLGPRALDHRDARNAGDLPRRARRSLRRQDRDHRQPAGTGWSTCRGSISFPSASSTSGRCSCWRSPSCVIFQFAHQLSDDSADASTPSAPTPTRPRSSACRCGASSSSPSCSRARWPALPASCSLARFGNITVEAGRGLELQVVAAVVVGGVNIFGGSGTVVGAMLGAVMIGIARAEPVPAADQRVLARRAPRPADPARRRQRRRHPAAPARALGARRPEADRQAAGRRAIADGGGRQRHDRRSAA